MEQTSKLFTQKIVSIVSDKFGPEFRNWLTNALLRILTHRHRPNEG